MVQSTLKYWRLATPKQRRDGTAWYRLAYLWCERAARRHRYPLRTVVAIVAVLSQRTTWNVTIRWTDNALRGDMPPHLTSVRNKVQQLLDGERVERVIRGPKIIEFYRAIMGDMDAIVLDTWMLQTLGHHRQSATQLQNAQLTAMLERDAKRAGAPPAIYQAVIWCAVRRRSF